MPEGGSLLLCCSEPGQREVAEAHLRERAGMAAAEVVTVPGGCWWIARASSGRGGKLRRWATQTAAGPIREAAGQWLSRPGITGISLWAHAECGWYRRRHPRASAGDLVRIQGDDLIAAAAEARSLTGLPVEGLFVAADGEIRALF